jgi:type I restriction enzyme, R subunit
VESEDRLKTILQEYYAADAERARVRPRKTIVFAVSEKQASILVRLFNKLLSDEDCLRIAGQINRSPSEVRQSFAKKITCYTNNGNPKPVIDEFKYDPLPLIAVSVDMLDTGYDQKDIENLIMLRPTKSPIKYAQMRGRGSRLCPKIGKKNSSSTTLSATRSGSTTPASGTTNRNWSASLQVHARPKPAN